MKPSSRWRYWKVYQDRLGPINTSGANISRLLTPVLWWSVGPLLLVVYAVFNPNWMAFLVFHFCVALQNTCLDARPPLLLFLGVSGANQIDLLNSLDRWANPYRIGHMLQPQAMQNLGEFTVSISSYRVVGGAQKTGEWEADLQELMELAPVIVLDARETSSALMSELDFVEKRDLGSKTIFIGDAPGEPQTPGDRQPAADAGQLAGCQVLDVGQLKPMARWLKRRNVPLPTREMPIRALWREATGAEK